MALADDVPCDLELAVVLGQFLVDVEQGGALGEIGPGGEVVGGASKRRGAVGSARARSLRSWPFVASTRSTSSLTGPDAVNSAGRSRSTGRPATRWPAQ